MYKQKKEIQRSIRMTKEIDEYIQNFEGDGFNDKLEKLVLFCIANEKNIIKEMTLKQKELNELNETIYDMRRLVNLLTNSVRNCEDLEDSITKCNSKIKSILKVPGL